MDTLDSSSTDSDLTRRGFLHSGAVLATAALTLRADATPTPATEDAHEYVNFLQDNGQPQIAPEGKWKPTHPDILGPFYAQGAPFRGKVTGPLCEGEPLLIRGRVWSHTTKKPLANTVIDVWQADHKGRYDFQDAGGRPQRKQFRNRIRLLTDETGAYEYETIMPAAYNAGGQIRPSHIHYLLQARGHKRLITQLYFRGDPHIARDPWASKSPLIIPLKTVKAGRGAYRQGVFDIVLGAA